MTIAGIVLAGGAASRFGGDKLAVRIEGRPLLHLALAAVGAVADELLLVLAPGTPIPELPDRLGRPLTVARDAVAHRGPLAGIAAALDAAGTSVDRVIVVGGDMPSLVPGVLQLLLAVLDRDPGLGAVTLEAREPAPLPVALRPAVVGRPLRDALASDRRSLRALLASVPRATVPAADWRAIDPDAATLRDVDRPEDLGPR